MQLPIYDILPDVFTSLKTHNNLVLLAPPGAGKTTVVPIELYRHTQKSILVLEPRRLAAKQVAMRMAGLLDESIGETVGYQIKGENKTSSATKILVVTEGILTRFLQSDPELSRFDIVIFDEFHERHLHSDLSLALCLQSQQFFREDLSLIVMSATLDGERIAALTNNAPVLQSEGRTYPVDVAYRAPTNNASRQQRLAHTTRCVLDALQTHQGDILVFLPGQGDITQLHTALQDQTLPTNTHVYPLYGSLSFEQQNTAIRPSKPGTRKVVLSTNIAETSLTIEGITVVIDTGLMRSAVFSPSSGMNTLEEHMISQSAAIQRAGRAGRLQAGTCYRLYPQSQFTQLPKYQSAEITRSDLSSLALDLAKWGVSDVEELAWLDRPPAGALAQARDILRTMGAINQQNQITPYGERITKTGLHPRLANMLLQSEVYGLSEDASLLAAMLSERDPLPNSHPDSDIHQRISAIKQGHPKVSKGLIQRIKQQATTYRKHTKDAAQHEPLRSPLGFLIALAYPDRIGKRQHIAERRYLLSSGKGANFYHDDPLVQHEYIAVAATQLRQGHATIQLAAELDLHDVQNYAPAFIQETLRLHWNDDKQSAQAVKEIRLGKIVIDSQLQHNVDKATRQQLLIDYVQQNQLRDIQWDKKTQSLLNKLAVLQEAKEQGISLPMELPKCDLPYLAEHIDTWLVPHLTDVTSLQALNKHDFYSMFIAFLGWNTLQTIETLLPSQLSVPSGSKITLDYSQYPPILPVRLQEMFGCHDTPRLINNQLPVLIHLLSPAHRPVQITQDLASFWEATYFDVKKELKIKYKKHYWPDNPLEAIATNKVKSRM